MCIAPCAIFLFIQPKAFINSSIFYPFVLQATVVRVVSQTAATARVASTLTPVPGLPAHLDRGKWLCTPIQLQQACTTTVVRPRSKLGFRVG